MAITQISRIQHRRGLKEQLPQLAAGELGYAVDTQELFIGNGTVAEGAPEVGNTKIITEDDNILSVANTYTYRGNTNSPVVTGVDSNTPVVRTLQKKLDDFANVKDFGAVGDGTTDDTAAINRAIANLQTVESTDKQKRALYFPGGTYKITGDVIKVYPNSNLIGDGMTSTVIKQTDATQACVIRTVDSQGQSGLAIGSSGAEKPNAIQISNMSFETTAEQDIMIIDQTEDMHVTNCHFTGIYNNQDGQNNNKASLVINSTQALPTKRLSFHYCTFQQVEYCVNVDDDVQDVQWNTCEFIKCFRAFNLAEGSDGSTGNKVTGPTGFVINASRFDLVDAEAVKIYNSGGAPTGNVVSSCSFRSTGDNADDSSERAVLQFDYGGNHSIGNYFHRADNVSAVTGNIYNESPVEHPVTLTANRTNQPTGLTIPTYSLDSSVLFKDSMSVIIHYVLTRNNNRRTGKIHVVGHESGSFNITDEFTEDGDTGTTFSVNTSGQLLYTSTAGSTSKFKYRLIDFL